MAVLDPSVACFRFFEKLSAIPHGSHNEQALSNWIVAFARERGLWVHQEPCGNIIIKADATPGYEHVPPVMLSCHLDMVCEKDVGSSHDFEKEPLALYIENGWLKAKGTTLGADDGCGIAMILAILDNPSLNHPKLECVFTTTEETGMFGAQELQTNLLEARRLICLDATGEKIILTTCTGGCRIHIRRPVRRIKAHEKGLRLVIQGLLGGHSGMFIAAGRGNATKLLGRFLAALERSGVSYELISMCGGSKDNVIANFAQADILCKDSDKAREVFREIYQELFNELLPVESDWTYGVTEIEADDPMCIEDTKAVVQLLRVLPDGVAVMSRQIEGLPSTSSNLGVLSSENDCVTYQISIRSAVESERQELEEKILLLSQTWGGSGQITGAYPGMPYTASSPFRQQYADIMEKVWGITPTNLAIHAGSEIGYFTEKIPGLEVVTLGPMIEDVHSPKERVHLASFQKCTEFLAAVLEQLNC